MMYRDNTAYDFDLFAPKSKVIDIPDAPGNKKRGHASLKSKNQANKAAGASLRQTVTTVATIAAVLLLVIAQLHCQLQNSEVVDQISQTEKEIETLQSENTRLQVELDGKVSFTNMEKMAQSMGMQKMTVAQIEYINLCNEDVAEVIKENKGLLASIQDLF